MRKGKKLRVLVTDSSALVRETLRSLISADEEFEIMAVTAAPYGAARCMGDEIPDVILLDADTKRMDGLSFLRRLMQQCPVPVIITITQDDHAADKERHALSSGAVDILHKSPHDTADNLLARAADIRQMLHHAATLKAEALKEKLHIMQLHCRAQKKLTADAVLPPRSHDSPADEETETVICFGASTGGTEALGKILRLLPGNAPAIVIVQHMPPKFTTSFARRLNDLCAIEVREAMDGDIVHSGLALIAPGDMHMLLERRSQRYFIEIRDGPPVTRHKPSVDVLFRSAARAAGRNAIGILLTGMGDDGAQGLGEMRASGALTIAQNEASSVVFGMPKEAIDRGAAKKIVPLDQMAREILKATRRSAARG